MMQRMGAACGKGRRVTIGLWVDNAVLVGRLMVSKASMGKEVSDRWVLDYERRGGPCTIGEAWEKGEGVGGGKKIEKVCGK
jgi:hypothetical protein